MNNTDALILLNMVEGLGPRGIKKICNVFPIIGEVFGQSCESLTSQCGLSQKIASKILEIASSDLFSKEKSFINEHGVEVLTLLDDGYPEALREIQDPPAVLYMMGKARLNDRAMAIVGARRASVYGREVAFRLGYELAARGISVVSGFARGIDTQAHLGALHAKGSTFAVLGSGLGVIYPPENKLWMDKILEQGGIISEFPSSTQPLPNHFPRRNRIISGLSLGVVVVEASRKSGSLITVDYALEQGREVFAVPGSVNSQNTKGVHYLIKQGARLVENVEDILDELALDTRDLLLENVGSLNTSEEKLLSCIDAEPKGIDQLMCESRLPTHEVLSVLFGLEMKKMIKQIPGKHYVISHKCLEKANVDEF